MRLSLIHICYVSQKFFETTGVKQTDFTQGSLKITLSNPLYSEEDIVAMQKAIRVEDRQIIEADYEDVYKRQILPVPTLDAVDTIRA